MWENFFFKSALMRASQKLTSVTLVLYFNIANLRNLNPIPIGQMFPCCRCHIDKVKEAKKRAAETTPPTRSQRCPDDVGKGNRERKCTHWFLSRCQPALSPQRQTLAHNNSFLLEMYPWNDLLFQTLQWFSHRVENCCNSIILVIWNTFELQVKHRMTNQVEEAAGSLRALSSCPNFPAVFLCHDFPVFFSCSTTLHSQFIVPSRLPSLF